MARKIHEIKIEVESGDEYTFRYRKASAAYMLKLSDMSPEKRTNSMSAVGLLQDCLVDQNDKPYNEKQVKELLDDLDSEALQKLTVACTPSQAARDEAKNG